MNAYAAVKLARYLPVGKLPDYAFPFHLAAADARTRSCRDYGIYARVTLA